MVKQVLVVRKDLNLTEEQIIIHCAHASMKVLLDKIEFQETIQGYETTFTPFRQLWRRSAPTATSYIKKEFAKYSIIFTNKMKKWFEGSYEKVFSLEEYNKILK